MGVIKSSVMRHDKINYGSIDMVFYWHEKYSFKKKSAFDEDIIRSFRHSNHHGFDKVVVCNILGFNKNNTHTIKDTFPYQKYTINCGLFPVHYLA